MKWTLVLLPILLNNVCAYKILVAFLYPGKSHSILGEGYVSNLLKAGHEVTYLTAIPIKKPHPNLKQIEVSSVIEHFEYEKSLDFKKLLSKEVDMSDTSELYRLMLIIGNRSLTHENVQKFLMESNDQYDLVVAEWLFHELYSGFAAIFNCPYVWSSSMEPHPMIMTLIDDIGNPAYFPDIMSPNSPPLTFSERVDELWNLLKLYILRWSIRDIEEKTFKAVFGPAAAKRGINLPTLEEHKHNSSLVLGNSHVSAGAAHPMPWNYIPIVGYHIEDDIPPLPENLQKIFDNSPHGVIYFSMGTMLKSKTLPMELKKDFLKMFSELKQTVIWKLEEVLPDLPKNVHTVQWAPQQSILAHPNCKLFITHGGLLSTTEALHFGVPVIGIPVFVDQFINVMRAIRKGFGLRVDIGYDTPANLKLAIEEILGNSKYKDKVKELSFIYHHRPTKPGAALVHWIEHVIATRGAPHLRSPSFQMPLYQKLYLDLLALIILGLVVVIRMIKSAAGKSVSSGKKDLKKKKR